MSYSYKPFEISPVREQTKLRSFLTTASVGFGAVLMAIFLNLFVFQSYFVDGESMSPTLHTNDRLIVSKVERTLSKATSKTYVPNRGDIVVINGNVSPQTTVNAPELIKRVVAIPGDIIDIRNGVVTITSPNSSPFNIDKELGLSLDPTYSSKDLSVRIPDGNVFVMGDNRSEGGSLDSRVFGLVDTDFIDGTLWARIMPFSERRVF